MKQVQEFTIEVVSDYECFYLLKNITDSDSIGIFHNTPSGEIPIDTLMPFLMPNGKILLAWNDLLPTSSMHNFIARSNDVSEIVNLSPLEKIIDIYDRPADSADGVFSFSNSKEIIAPGTDWRCDNGIYGPRPFNQNMMIINQLSDIEIFETVLSINGVSHISYLQVKNKTNLADEYFQNGEIPNVGRTFWEILKIIREWAIVNEEPFNNNEEISVKAKKMIDALNLSQEELGFIDEQTPMQVANYISGNLNARQRPEGISDINDNIKRILFSRMASGTVSALEYLNPGIWDLQQLVEIEKNKMLNDVAYFLKAVPYGIPAHTNRSRLLTNKNTIITKIENNTL